MGGRNPKAAQEESWRRARMNRTFTESVVEQAALAWLENIGWTVRNGTEIAPGEPR